MAANVFDARDAGPATTAGRDPFDLSVREITDGDAFDHSLCRRLSRDAALPREHGCWPRQARQDATLLAVADGLVVGRAVLEAPYLPYAELVNLCVRPDYRHRGAATAIVREALTRARAAGFKHLVVQEYLDEAQAHNVYLRSGFLPATVGEFRRLVHLVDVPLVSLFRQAHPEARHESLADPRFGDQWWKLAWTAGDDQVALFLHGGSCQSDSDGFQPVVQACELRSPERGFTARLESASRAKRGDTTTLSVAVEALSPGGFEGIVRAMLPADPAQRAEAVRDGLGIGERDKVEAEGAAGPSQAGGSAKLSAAAAAPSRRRSGTKRFAETDQAALEQVAQQVGADQQAALDAWQTALLDSTRDLLAGLLRAVSAAPPTAPATLAVVTADPAAVDALAARVSAWAVAAYDAAWARMAAATGGDASPARESYERLRARGRVVAEDLAAVAEREVRLAALDGAGPSEIAARFEETVGHGLRARLTESGRTVAELVTWEASDAPAQ